MTKEVSLTVLVIGATGSVGRHVVAEALAKGHRGATWVRVLARDRRHSGPRGTG